MKKRLRFMGVINVSPESFYQGSVPKGARELAALARRLTKEGADVLDIGAMSTAPYLKTRIMAEEEARRLDWAVRVVRKNSRLPISIDTSRYEPAAAGLKAGAKYLNDVTGLCGDPRLLKLAKKFKGLILMANPMALSNGHDERPIVRVKKILEAALRKAKTAGIPRSRLIVDPGIGFFRTERISWWEWDLSIIKDLQELTALKCPILVGISRKSFVGHLMGGAPPEERLEASIAVTRFAVQNGVTWIRTHDVKATRKALAGNWTLEL